MFKLRSLTADVVKDLLSGTRSWIFNNAETHRESSELVVILIIKVKSRNSNYAKEQIRIRQTVTRTDIRRRTRNKRWNDCCVDKIFWQRRKEHGG